MLKNTGISVDTALIEELSYEDFINVKTSINQPTGNFFYDLWEIKEEYKDTVWEKLLDTLPKQIGEARVIILESEKCYTKHSDIDDRYHLNLHGDCAFLLDLENQYMYETKQDNQWYEMDAGVLHSAASFGEHKRIQLVVRKLLKYTTLGDPVLINIDIAGPNPRYRFDNTLSSWLNKAHKKQIINDFKVLNNQSTVSFFIEKDFVSELKRITPNQFTVQEIS